MYLVADSMRKWQTVYLKVLRSTLIATLASHRSNPTPNPHQRLLVCCLSLLLCCFACCVCVCVCVRVLCRLCLFLTLSEP